MSFLQLSPFFDEANAVPFWLVLIFAACTGAIIGSFLNVVIHRVPLGESIVFPNSRCPVCRAAIRAYDNVPILSYLWLGGRCRGCGTRISPRYPAVELLTAVIFTLTALHTGLTLALPFDLLFVAALLALIFIDAEHMILPDRITYPGMLFALVARAVVPNLYGVELITGGALAGWPAWAVSLAGAVIGGLLGGGSLWLVGWLWERLRGVEAMGLGDVKMMFMVGAYLGWPLTILTIFLGVLTGSIIGISQMLWERSYDSQKQLPFGIFLGLGALISLLFGAPIVNWYAGQFQ